MTYAELSQLIQDYMESTETTMAGNVDNFIEFSEKKIYRSVDLSEGHKYQTATMTIGDEFVSLPSDCVDIRSVQVIDASTNDRTTLEQKDSTFMDESIIQKFIQARKSKENDDDKKDKTLEMLKDLECPICYDEFENLDILKCGVCRTAFHNPCINIWLQTSHNKSCPYCRSPLKQTGSGYYINLE